MYDVVIVGAGPAGLSAALMLGRCRRGVLVCDAGRPRNAASGGVHGFLSRDGIEPAELLLISREQLRQYDTVELRDVEVLDVGGAIGRFQVTLAGGRHVRARRVLIATGVVDHLPKVEGIHDFYGGSVFHCPYCDGWEMRDQPLAVYGRGKQGMGLALELTQWSRDLVLCTDGPARLRADQRKRLARNRIRIDEGRIARLEGSDGVLERIVFDDGRNLERRGIFFTTGQAPRCDIARKLGCEFTGRGTVRTGKFELTNVPGLYVAGDASHDVQWVVVAAAEGARAAFAINTALLKEDLK
jgi:thioredoxin reductase